MPIEQSQRITPLCWSVPLTSRISDYIALTKPRITLVVVMTAWAGFVLGSTSINGVRLFHTLLGIALISAGAAALNMLLEKESDALMNRTKNRPLPANRLSSQEAFLLGSLLGSVGIVHIAVMVNLSAGFMAALSLTNYLICYTPMKKRSPFCTLVGAVSGAFPPIIGWISAKGEGWVGWGGWGGWSLFLILFLWQFPHLLSLAWIYREDYARAKFKMAPVPDASGAITAGIALMGCLILLPISLVPFWLKLSGTLYLWGSVILGTFFIGTAIYFLSRRNDASAKTLFLTSLSYLSLLLVLMVAGR